jgi:hypothetical protein
MTRRLIVLEMRTDNSLKGNLCLAKTKLFSKKDMTSHFYEIFDEKF